MYKLIWTTIWGTLGLFRHYMGVHYVYLSTIKGCIIAIRGYCTPQKRPSENTDSNGIIKRVVSELFY